jgi:inorganic pyrophosphatase
MSLSKINIGNNSPDKINVVVEIPRGSHHKYEYDDNLEAIKLDRVLHSAVFYPMDYGFIPETLAQDGDHLDALVFITEPLFPGCVVTVRPIGALDMEDQAGQDWKIITVAETDPKLSNIQSINDIDNHYRNEIEQFFKEYKKLENKIVTVRGWLPKADAIKLIESTHKLYLGKNNINK